MDFYFGLISATLLTFANALSIEQSTAPPTAYPQDSVFENCGFKLNATCDDKMKLFVDGELLATSDDWKNTSVVYIPPNTGEIEIRCTDGWILGGILASSENGLITNNAWNCSSDNGTTWNNAHELGANGVTAEDISADAKWIWTDRPTWTHTKHKRHTTAICKILLPTPSLCDCPFNDSTPTPTPIPTPTPTPAPSPTPTPGFSLNATCNNKMELFANGNLLATSYNWRNTSQVNIPANTTTIEIHCTDSCWIVEGILGSSDDGLLTDDSWNCSSDNGITWSSAHEIVSNALSVPGISPNAKWISTGPNTWVDGGTVICKVNLDLPVPTTTKTKVTTTASPVSTPVPKGCMFTDKYVECSKFKHLCKTGKFVDCMNRNCAKTCKCAIDGAWSTWSEFSSCSASCGNGIKSRSRTCSNPPPSIGGKSCPGLEEEDVSCGLSFCNSIYFIAGGYGADANRDIELYHATMDNTPCSISPPPLNNNWRYHTTFYYNNTIHLYGGWYTASTCISYNINMEEWKTHTLSTSRSYGHSSTILNKRIYIIGGIGTSGNYVGAETTPLPLTDQPVLTPENNLDYKGYYHCTAKVDENNLVVTGGYNGGYSSSVIEYNAKTRTTTSLPSMKQPIGYHGCAVVEMDNTKWIIAAGGYNRADKYLKTTEMLQIGVSSWKPLGNLNVARSGHSIVVTQRGVMAMGGYSGGYLSSVELLDWSAMSWRIVQPSLSKSRYQFGGAVEITASMFDCRGTTTTTAITTTTTATTTTAAATTTTATTTTTITTATTTTTTAAITTTSTTTTIVTTSTTTMTTTTKTEKLWRDDERCGESYPLRNGHPGQCNPNGVHPCCSDNGWCGKSGAHCKCSSCINYAGEQRRAAFSFSRQEHHDVSNISISTEQQGLKLQFQLKGKIGIEKVKITVDDTDEEFGLTTEWRLFSYPRPTSEFFSVEFLNDIGYTDVFIRGHESQVTDLLPNFPASKFLGCGTKNEDEKCGSLRKGTLMWNGKYTYTLKGQ